MSSTAAKVRETIAGFAANMIFTTLEMLRCGGRNAVDIQLCRMVKDGSLARLAQGVFVRTNHNVAPPSVQEIAAVKASRFGKRITEQPRATTARSGKAFYTDGSKSSFKTVHGRVFFKHIAPGKINGSYPNCNSAFKFAALPSSRPKPAQTAPLPGSDERFEQQVLRLSCRVFQLVISLFENDARPGPPTLSTY